MIKPRSRLLPGSLLATLAVAAHAAEEAKKTWDVNAPPGERREIPIDVHSGTWLSVDVSPDGSRVLFDLLGDIYELPIAGGEAKSLTSGLAWDMQPLRRLITAAARSVASSAALLLRLVSNALQLNSRIHCEPARR